MNREDRELRRNGEGYLDLTAYHAIKKADADLESKRGSDKRKSNGRSRGFYVGPHDRDRKMSIKQYIKQKIKVLNELCVSMTEEEEEQLRSLTNEVDVDQFAHRLIMRGED